MRNLNELIEDLPNAQREEVIAGGQKLITEEHRLRQLRKSRDFTQENIASSLKIDQAGVSKLEKRSDMLISTIRGYVEALGGALRLTVDFKDGVSVEIGGLGDVMPEAGNARSAPRARVDRSSEKALKNMVAAKKTSPTFAKVAAAKARSSGRKVHVSRKKSPAEH